ncbi:hypothetical protein PAPYR_10610 [Paratrimastix pyriformis]|uniref:FYR N-terminal domain-containing protein n=1 Tax=Paratrimastix pyriformis TaxID=342808 RepID=A0ABQ8U5L4_9EUKA|nr:hypothetical protein PAPYR_10610 [Paratrimastix pyriformis]
MEKEEEAGPVLPKIDISRIPPERLPPRGTVFDDLPADASTPPSIPQEEAPVAVSATVADAKKPSLEDRLAAVADPEKAAPAKGRKRATRERKSKIVSDDDDDDTPKKKKAPAKKKSTPRKKAELVPAALPDDLPADINFSVGDSVLVNTGIIVHDRLKYHTVNHMFPVGYKYRCKFTCVKHPKEKHMYTSEIFECGDLPLFRVTCECDPSQSWTTTSASSSWSQVLKTLNALIANPRQTCSIQGTRYFGLTEPDVRKKLEALPGANKLANYVRDADREAPDES